MFSFTPIKDRICITVVKHNTLFKNQSAKLKEFIKKLNMK